MLEVAIMVEGQNGLNWPRWKRLAQAVEDLGFVGLYRSDHFTNAEPPDLDALELWVSLTWLASHTKRIEFGPLVTPVSFRHPIHTARMARDVDDLSGGRLTLGVGAGWQVREHTLFGFDLLEVPERFNRFEESLEVITRLLCNAETVDFQGDYYRLHGATLLPHPQRPGGPPLLIGGNGPQRTLPLAARYANEWNAVYLTPAAFAARSEQLNTLLKAAGREFSTVRRSLMTGLVFAQTEPELRERVAARTPGGTAEMLRQQGLVVGTPQAVQEQLETLAAVGVQRVMLQWLDLDDMAGLETLAHTVC